MAVPGSSEVDTHRPVRPTLQHAVISQQADPARGVSLDQHRFAISHRVSVWCAVAQDREYHPKHLVGGGHDGAPVSAAYGQRLMVAAELALVGAHRAVSTFDEHRAQHLAASAGRGMVALAGALAIARTKACPGRQMLRLGKRGQVRSHLDRDRARRRAVDSGDRLEQAHPVGEGRDWVGAALECRGNGMSPGGGRGQAGRADQDATATRDAMPAPRCAVQLRVLTVHGRCGSATVTEVLPKPRSASTPGGRVRWWRANE